jgi:hypothetical protein
LRFTASQHISSSCGYGRFYMKNTRLARKTRADAAGFSAFT